MTRPAGNPMTECNDEHYVTCLNALERDAAKRATHRASKAAMGFQREPHTGLVHLDEPLSRRAGEEMARETPQENERRAA